METAAVLDFLSSKEIADQIAVAEDRLCEKGAIGFKLFYERVMTGFMRNASKHRKSKFLSLFRARAMLRVILYVCPASMGTCKLLLLVL